MARVQRHLGGKMNLFGMLSTSKIDTGQEVGTWVLAVRVEEQVVDGPIDVIVVGHVAPGAATRIELLQPSAQTSRRIEPAQPCWRCLRSRVAHQQLQQIVDATLLDDQPALHVGLAESQLGIPGDRQFGGPVSKSNGHLGAGPISKPIDLPFRVSDLECAADDDPAKYGFQWPEHGGASWA